MIAALWSVIGIRGVVVIAVIAAVAWWHFSSVSDAYSRGQMNERIVWQEKERRAILKAEKDLEIAQTKINEAETELVTVQQESSLRRRAMETALEQERAENAKAGTDRSVCVLPDRVRDALKYRN